MIKVFITPSGGVTCFDILSDEPNGVALTFEELEQREREAWDAALETLPPVATDKGMRSKYQDFDDYLEQRNREQALSELVADGEKNGDYDDQAN